jgi:hypothetical protein
MTITPTATSAGTQLAVVGTEHGLMAGSVAGVFDFHIDTRNMVAGDYLEARIYQKVVASGATCVAYMDAWGGAQPSDDYVKISMPIGNTLGEASALNFTLKQTLGVGRNFPYSIVQY